MCCVYLVGLFGSVCVLVVVWMWSFLCVSFALFSTVLFGFVGCCLVRRSNALNNVIGTMAANETVRIMMTIVIMMMIILFLTCFGFCFSCLWLIGLCFVFVV